MTFSREAHSRLAIPTDAGRTEAGQDLVLDMAFASELPYERYFGIEILDCSPGAVRLGRLNDGGALLYNHDWDALRGHHVPGTARVDADRVLRSQVAISWDADDGKTIRLIEGNHLTKTSVGYEIHRVVEHAKNKAGADVTREIDGAMFGRVLERCQRESPGDVTAFRRALDAKAGAFERATDTPATYRVIDWEPLENSLVSVPADPSVGKGRSKERAVPQAQTTPDTQLPPETPNMTIETQEAPKPDHAAIARDAVAADRVRVAEIEALADAHAMRGVSDLVRHAKESGQSLNEFRASLLNHIRDHGEKWSPEIGMDKKEARRYSVVRAINAMISGDWTDAGFEREASKAVEQKAQKSGIQRSGTPRSFFLPAEVQRRDMTVGVAANGGNMVATELRPQDFIGLLRSRTLLRDLGARYLTGLVGNADITRQTGAGTGYWLANEATGITESNQTLGLLQLRPKVLGAYTEISRLLLQQSTPDADTFVMDDLAKVLANSLDIAGINVGGSGAPVGVLGTAGIGSVTGTAIDYAKALKFQTDVAGANALSSNCAYLTTPAVAALLAQRQKFASTDTPIWTGNILDGNVLGFRGATTTAMPAGTMVFGDFSQVIFAEWGVLEIDVNPYANFPAGITGVRAMMTTDVGVRVAGAFSAASSIT